MKRVRVFAVSGVKNAGKTTLITGLVREFRRRGFSAAVIKHDDRRFIQKAQGEPEAECSSLREAGALGTAVFSNNRVTIVREAGEISLRELIRGFSDADIVILEGFKHSEYPKVEVVRGANLDEPVCDPRFLVAIATDVSSEEFSEGFAGIPAYGLEEIERLAEDLLENPRCIFSVGF